MQLAEACGGHPNRVLVIPDSMNCREAKVFRAHTAPQGMCSNLVNALKLLANQQKDGDSPVNMVVQCFSEKSRLKTKGLGRFTTVDSQETVKVGDLEKRTWSRGQW